MNCKALNNETFTKTVSYFTKHLNQKRPTVKFLSWNLIITTVWEGKLRYHSMFILFLSKTKSSNRVRVLKYGLKSDSLTLSDKNTTSLNTQHKQQAANSFSALFLNIEEIAVVITRLVSLY